MKIKSQTRDNNTVHLEIEEDSEKLAQAREKALARAGREIRIPGFRPGKAPKGMVARAIDPDYIESHAAQDVIADLYPEIIKETDLSPVDYPNVEIVQHEKDKPFIFKLSVDVYPEVKLGKYKGLKVEKKSAEVSELDIEKTLGNLQQRFSQVGAAGQKELLPLDDEFAKKVSRFGTLAELKEEVRSVMQQDRLSEAEADLKNQLVAAASLDTKMDIPKGMVEREINIMLDELAASLTRSGLTLDDYLKGVKKEEQSLREEMRKSAEIRVKGKIVLKAIAEEEKLKVSAEEFEAEVNNMASASGEPVADLRKRLDEGAREYIEEYLLRRKALDFLLEKAKISEAKPAKEETK